MVDWKLYFDCRIQKKTNSFINPNPKSWSERYKMTSLRSGRFLLTHMLCRKSSKVNAIPRLLERSQIKTDLHVISLGSNMCIPRLMATSAVQPEYDASKDLSTIQKLEASMHSINLYVQRTNRVLYYDFMQFKKLFLKCDELKPIQALFGLRCCGDAFVDVPGSERLKYTDELWSHIKKTGVTLDISHFNTLLRVYLDNGRDFSPPEFLAEIAKEGLQPNRVTYQHLVAKYCQVRKIPF